MYKFKNELHGTLRQCDEHARVEYLTMYNENKRLLKFKEDEVKRLDKLKQKHINFASNKTFDPETILEIFGILCFLSLGFTLSGE